MRPDSTNPGPTAPRRFFLSLLAVLILVATPLNPARAAQVVAATAKTLKLEMDKGLLVKLDRPATTVFIANPEIADVQVKSPRLVYVMARKPGETTLYAADGNERILANMGVVVTHNLTRLRTAMRELYPREDVRVSTVDGALVLDGVVKTAATAENLRRLATRFVGSEDDAAVAAGRVINRIAVVEPNQINLRVRVAEINRDIDKQLGFNWNIVGAIGGFSFGLATANPFSANVVQHVLSTAIDRTIGNTTYNANAMIDALEQEGLITILAEPNLTALSGETASFLAGGEFPILVPDSNGRIKIDFKHFGVSLAFTPTLIGDRINLHVRPEVSQLSNDGAINFPIAGGVVQVPALTTRRAETVIELGSGQSFAIAGLLQNNITHDISKFPGLGDVPVLGGLFRSDRFQRDESELVIIVTPYVVEPVSTRMASPLDGFQPPHDVERLLGTGTHRRNPVVGQAQTLNGVEGGLVGPVGFELD